MNPLQTNPEGEGVNEPPIFVLPEDIENEEVLSEEELDNLKSMIKEIKAGAEERSAEGNARREEMLGEQKIVDVDVSELENDDFMAFKKLLDFEEGRASYEETFGVLDRHKSKLGEYIASQREKDPSADFTSLPRVAFSFWMANRLISEQAKRSQG